MKSRDFVYWLQGFIEIADPKELNEDQLKVIKSHLNMVFIHEIDPSDGDADMQEELNKAHSPGYSKESKSGDTPDWMAGQLMRC
jgi:hypothetical protein